MRKTSEADRATIRALAVQGMSAREIEREMGGRASKSTIAAFLSAPSDAPPPAALQPGSVDADLAFLEEELHALRERARGARSGTLKAHTDVVRAVADLTARVQKMRPPPALDPADDPRNIAARAELRQRLERLIAGAEAQRIARDALATVVR